MSNAELGELQSRHLRAQSMNSAGMQTSLTSASRYCSLLFLNLKRFCLLLDCQFVSFPLKNWRLTPMVHEFKHLLNRCHNTQNRIYVYELWVSHIKQIFFKKSRIVIKSQLKWNFEANVEVLLSQTSVEFHTSWCVSQWWVYCKIAKNIYWKTRQIKFLINQKDRWIFQEN